MDTCTIQRLFNEARGYAELGMFVEAWEAIEELPSPLRTTAMAVAVRLGCMYRTGTADRERRVLVSHQGCA